MAGSEGTKKAPENALGKARWAGLLEQLAFYGEYHTHPVNQVSLHVPTQATQQPEPVAFACL